MSHPKENIQKTMPFGEKLFAGILAATLVIWSIWATKNLTIWYEEGVINYKGWLFIKGYFRAYQDIWTEYLPLALFPKGLFQSIFGPSMLAGRVFSSFFFLLGTGAVAAAALRIGGAKSFLIALLLSTGHLFSSSYFCTGSHHSLAMTFCALSILFMTLDPKRVKGTSLAALFAALAALTMPIMFVMGFAFLLYIVTNRGFKRASMLFWFTEQPFLPFFCLFSTG